jgi:hypothetical protein
MFDNKPTETQYFYTDDDSAGALLHGKNSYEITFAPGEDPPVNGFWSLTLYNEDHSFHPNDWKRCSLGTKNKTLTLNGHKEILEAISGAMRKAAGTPCARICVRCWSMTGQAIVDSPPLKRLQTPNFAVSGCGCLRGVLPTPVAGFASTR